MASASRSDDTTSDGGADAPAAKTAPKSSARSRKSTAPAKKAASKKAVGKGAGAAKTVKKASKKAAAKPVEDLHPDLDGDLARLPMRLSPSRAKDYMQCPKLFHFKTILGVREPNTIHTARGSLAHEALERLFDHPRPERTRQTGISYLLPIWERMRAEEAYEHLIPAEPDEDGNLPWTDYDDDMIATATECILGYFNMENPKVFDPVGIELWLKAQNMVAPMHGIIDRFDRYETKSGEVRWTVSDYKSGKVPSPRYAEETWFAMKVYALLARDMLGIKVHQLRLLYIRNGSLDTIKTLNVDDAMLDRTEKQCQALWQSIMNSARLGDWPVKTGPLCNYCYFQNDCPAFNPLADGQTVTVDAPRAKPAA